MSNFPRRIRPLSDAEDRKIRRAIEQDPDTEEITPEMMARAKPFAEALPELAESIKRSRGRPRVQNPKQAISLRLDPEVIEKFKATGKGWQARINKALKDADV